jgi:D-aminopeptidase
MKLFLMTDLEGVAGVINGPDWLYPSGRYYENAKRLLTQEVNAAVEAFADGGFEDILVCDGHGSGGIDLERLDPRARMIRGWPRQVYPFGMDRSFDALAFVGQHAKAGTPHSHLTHTGWWDVKDSRVNGVSLGEYGELALCAGELGLPVIFAAGEKALCAEAAALTPWVVTAAVLEGTIGGSGDELGGEQYERFHEGAIHLAPSRACDVVRAAAREACAAFRAGRARFKPLALAPPYRLERETRAYQGRPAGVVRAEHADSVIGLLNRARG